MERVLRRVGGARRVHPIGVIAGQFLTTVIGEKVLHWIAGLGFVAIGLWTLCRA